MELLFCKWAFALMVSCCLIISVTHSVARLNGDSKVRAVNLGGWLVVEGWIKPSLFDEIPNSEMLDGTKIQLKSVTLRKFLCAENGGGEKVSVNRSDPSLWETFRLWRVTESEFQLRTSGGQFLTCDDVGGFVTATEDSPSAKGTFQIEKKNTRIHLKVKSGSYLQVSSRNQLTADYPGKPGWDDNAATFEMMIVENNLHGDYQLANGYGHDMASDILKRHRSTFITMEDFDFLSRHGINAVRIPVGWWIAFDPDPPTPFIGGSLEVLDNAFSWGQDYGIKCIIDLHAAPGSQNGMEHSASRDGSTEWPMSSDNINQTLHVIDFLASRYANRPTLLGIELLNEPSAATVPLDILVLYYKKGYDIVRKYSPTAYVLLCQRIGRANPIELYEANIGVSNTVVDLHYYNLFNSFFDHLSSADNIEFIYKNRQPQLQALNSANGPLVFIGEWVNEWNVTGASRRDYQDFGRAQLEVYDAASFGWAYWTIRNEEKHWDFEWNIVNKYLQLGCSPDWMIFPVVSLLGSVCTFIYLNQNIIG